MEGITRKVLNRGGDTESFSGTLLKIAEDFEATFNWMLGRGPRPDFVRID